MEPTVLLVCSEDLRAQLTLRMLRREEIAAEQAGTLEEVGERLRAQPHIRVVLLDWRMPIPKAAEWALTWRQMAGAAPPVFLLIAERLPIHTEANEAFEKGVSDIWMRPLPDYLLASRLRVWLRQGAAGPARADSALTDTDSPAGGMDSPVTGEGYSDREGRVLTRELFLDLTEGFFKGSRRLSLYVGMLAITIANLDDIERRAGPAARTEALLWLGRELQRIKRAEDILGRWDERAFVLASYFPNGDAVQAFGSRTLGELQALRPALIAQTGPLKFLVTGAWGPSRDYPLAKDTLEAIVAQTRAGA